VESIKDQLAKPVPNKSVVRQLWADLERVSTLSGVADAYGRVSGFLVGLLSWIHWRREPGGRPLAAMKDLDDG